MAREKCIDLNDLDPPSGKEKTGNGSDTGKPQRRWSRLSASRTRRGKEPYRLVGGRQSEGTKEKRTASAALSRCNYLIPTKTLVRSLLEYNEPEEGGKHSADAPDR